MKLLRYLIFCLGVLGSFQNLHAFKEHEIWWEQCLDEQVSMETFKSWLGSVNARSRVAVREHVKNMGYTSILDVPCGVCADYYGFEQNKIQIAYQGLDITPKLVALHTSNNIPVVQGSIENIPFADGEYDVCYARHILEHLEGYEQALAELVRVAKKEVLVVFFINPDLNLSEMNLKFHNGHLLYHNKYNKSELENFVMNHPKVMKIEWEEMGIESILHIYLNDY